MFERKLREIDSIIMPDGYSKKIDHGHRWSPTGKARGPLLPGG